MSEPQPARTSRLRQVGNRRFWTAVSAVLAGLAAAAGVLGFALDFVSSSEAAGCEGRTAAALENPTVEKVTLGYFLSHVSSSEDGDPLEGYSQRQLGTHVHYVSVVVSVDGQKGKPITLRWSMEDASRLGAGDLPQNRNAVEITPASCGHEHPAHVLLDPPVPRGRTVVVKLFLQDEEGNQLAPEVRTNQIRAIS